MRVQQGQGQGLQISNPNSPWFARYDLSEDGLSTFWLAQLVFHDAQCGGGSKLSSVASVSPGLQLLKQNLMCVRLLLFHSVARGVWSHDVKQETSSPEQGITITRDHHSK